MWSQEKYLWSQDDKFLGDHFSTWWVPLTYTSQDSPDFNDTRVKAWLKDTETQTSLQYLPRKDHWIIVNVQQTGYYRVNYDDHNWNLLIQQLLTDHRLIHVNNRGQMVDDVLNLASNGKKHFKKIGAVHKLAIDHFNLDVRLSSPELLLSPQEKFPIKPPSVCWNT